jgi:hypothetical protein
MCKRSNKSERLKAGLGNWGNDGTRDLAPPLLLRNYLKEAPPLYKYRAKINTEKAG